MSRCIIGINNIGGKFAAGVTYIATGINDTGGKFANNTASVVDTGGNDAGGAP